MGAPQFYTPAINAVLKEARLSPLGPGTPNEAMRSQLAALTMESAFAPETVKDRDMAACCLAGLWLHHDFIDEAHKICQDIDTPSGSYWHGIVHRREPEFPNAAYWFRRVGKHPIFASLPEAARQLDRNMDIPSPWNPFWFIDYCEACTKGKQSGEQFARRLQAKEWELLFGFCYRKAIGGA